MESLRREVRYAARVLAKHPLAAAAAVLSIGIGVGFNVGTYAVLRHVLFDSPLTANAPERVIRLEPGLSFPDFQDLRRMPLPVDLAAMQMGALTWQNGDTPRTISAHIVSGNFFEMLGVRPRFGRTLIPSDVDAADVVIVTSSFWAQHLASDPAVIGRSLELNARPYTIIGVLPEGFAANPVVAGVVYVPISPHVSVALDNRRAAQFDILGRLHDGIGREEATSALRVAAARLEGRSAEASAAFSRGLAATSLDAFSMLSGGSAGRIALAAAGTLYGLMGLVLVIAGANVSGLLLMRADERRREIAVRVALGATRGRLARHAFVESLLIAAGGCAVGLSLWIVTVRILRSTIAGTGTIDVSALSTPVPVGYAVVLLAAITIGCGLASAAQIARSSGADALQIRSGGGLTRRFAVQRVLVVVQIAVCFVLLIADAFFLANVIALRRADAGFDVARVFSVEVRVPVAVAARDQLAIRRSIQAEPGVEAVSWGSPIGPPFTERLHAAPGTGVDISTDIRPVGPRFFETMRIPIVHGRDAAEADTYGGSPTRIIVNETFVRRYVSAGSPIGRQFVRPGNADSGRPAQTLEIVGVARDSMARTIGESRVPVVYVPQPSRSFTIRLRHTDASAAHRLQERIRQFEPAGSVVTVVPLADEIAAALEPVRIATTVLGILAIIGLVLATTGLYAAVNYAVSQRTVELGIRVALGATRGRIMTLVLSDGSRIVAVGCALGVVASWVLTRVVQTLIVGQSIVGAGLFVAVTCMLVAITVAAMLHPAQRAASADPIKSLRYE